MSDDFMSEYRRRTREHDARMAELERQKAWVAGLFATGILVTLVLCLLGWLPSNPGVGLVVVVPATVGVAIVGWLLLRRWFR